MANRIGENNVGSILGSSKKRSVDQTERDRDQEAALGVLDSLSSRAVGSAAPLGLQIENTLNVELAPRLTKKIYDRIADFIAPEPLPMPIDAPVTIVEPVLGGSFPSTPIAIDLPVMTPITVPDAPSTEPPTLVVAPVEPIQAPVDDLPSIEPALPADPQPVQDPIEVIPPVIVDEIPPAILFPLPVEEYLLPALEGGDDRWAFRSDMVSEQNYQSFINMIKGDQTFRTDPKTGEPVTFHSVYNLLRNDGMYGHAEIHSVNGLEVPEGKFTQSTSYMQVPMGGLLIETEDYTLVVMRDGDYMVFARPGHTVDETLTYTFIDEDGNISAPVSLEIQFEDPTWSDPINTVMTGGVATLADGMVVGTQSMFLGRLHYTGLTGNPVKYEILDPTGHFGSVQIQNDPRGDLLVYNINATPESFMEQRETDIFAIQVTDAAGNTTIAAAIFQISSDGTWTPVLDTVVEDDSGTSYASVPVSGNLFSNDHQGQGGEFVASIGLGTDADYAPMFVVDGAASGTATIKGLYGQLIVHSDGSFVYTGSSGANGTDTFVYEIRTGDGEIEYGHLVLTADSSAASSDVVADDSTLDQAIADFVVATATSEDVHSAQPIEIVVSGLDLPAADAAAFID